MTTKAKSKRMDLLVWWLAEADYCGFHPEQDKNPLKLADYIWEEFTSLCGRAGRGRLWVPNHIRIEKLDAAEDDPRWPEYIEAGGIVIERKDAPACALWGGRFTDFKLNPVTPRKHV